MPCSPGHFSSKRVGEQRVPPWPCGSPTRPPWPVQIHPIAAGEGIWWNALIDGPTPSYSMSKAIVVLIFVLIEGTLGFASAERASNRWWLDVNLTSRHSRDTYWYQGREQRYNANNFGLGLSYDWTDWCDFKAGWFNNSYHKTSLYAVVHPQYDLWRSPHHLLALGAGVGAVTGYEHTVENLPAVSPIGILTLVISDVQHWRATVGYLPFRLVLGDAHADVLTLQASWKL